MALALITDKINPVALRKAKIVYNFGISECSRVTYYIPKKIPIPLALESSAYGKELRSQVH